MHALLLLLLVLVVWFLAGRCLQRHWNLQSTIELHNEVEYFQFCSFVRLESEDIHRHCWVLKAVSSLRGKSSACAGEGELGNTCIDAYPRYMD
jgi:hypothetical protein